MTDPIAKLREQPDGRLLDKLVFGVAVGAHVPAGLAGGGGAGLVCAGEFADDFCHVAGL